MDRRGKRLIVIGGAGLIGSHIVVELTREDVGEIVVYDNFARGTAENLQGAVKDPGVKVYEVGGDILPDRYPERRPQGCGRSVLPRRALAAAVPGVPPRRVRREYRGHLQRPRSLRRQRCEAAGLLLVGLCLRRCGR